MGFHSLCCLIDGSFCFAHMLLLTNENHCLIHNDKFFFSNVRWAFHWSFIKGISAFNPRNYNMRDGFDLIE